MRSKFRHIGALLLVMLFLMPNIVKLEHHHNHAECHESKSHIHDHHDQCLLCHFEFPLFTSEPVTIRIAQDAPISEYRFGEQQGVPELQPAISFFQRGPPITQI